MNGCGVMRMRAWACPCAARSVADASTVALYESIDAVPAAWDDLTAGQSLFLQRNYLRLLELHGPAGLGHRYALIERDGHTIAAVAAQVVDVDDELLAVRDRTAFNAGKRPVFDRLTTWLRNRGLGMLGRRVLVCGNLFSCGLDGLALAPGEDAQATWPLVLDALRKMQQADRRIAFLLIKDLSAQDDAHRAAFATAGYAHLRVEPSMDLHADPAWTSRADYLQALNTKYRKAALRLDAQMAEAGCTLEPLPNLRPEQACLHALYLQVEQRAVMRFGSVGLEYLPNFAEWAGPDRFRCTVIRQGSEIVGYSAVFKSGYTALAHMVGFDTAANERAPIYLRLLHSIIDDGLALGCTTLHYGRTALEPKARLGATPTDTELWLRHANPVVNMAVGPLLQLVPQDVAPQREPFRKHNAS